MFTSKISSLLVLSVLFSSSLRLSIAVEALPPTGGCNLGDICLNPTACPIMQEDPPDEYDVLFCTNVGRFNVHVTTAWAPPFAKRFWQLSRLKYMEGGRFYRVCSVDFSNNATKRDPFVIQFGLRGDPEVDSCWQNNLTSNAPGGPVVPPGNQRGYVSFSMDSQLNKTVETPYCQYPEKTPYCAIGFSQEIFINLGNNSKLDAPGFSVFGKIDDTGMRTVDRIYKWYGDVTDLCPDGSTDVFCNGLGADCKGVNYTRLATPEIGGEPYLMEYFPKLTYIRYVETNVTK